jgi:lipopolysaccharide biosynthesis glycosyltransferase
MNVLICLLSFFQLALFCCSQTSDGEAVLHRGRFDSEWPSPRCCEGQSCLDRDKGHYAVVTYLRSENYIGLLRHFACAMYNSKTTFKLIVIMVPGDLSVSAMRNVSLAAPNAELMFIPDFRVENRFRSRFSLNWLKLRLWELDEFDCLLFVDVDALVVRDISALFRLPTAMAIGHDEDKGFVARFISLGSVQSGVLLVRPCPAVAKHMLDLVAMNASLRFECSHAEQNFLDWYFRYERMILPPQYNSISHRLITVTSGAGAGETERPRLTRGGLRPAIVHYTRGKPFTLNPEIYPEHRGAMNCAAKRNKNSISVDVDRWKVAMKKYHQHKHKFYQPPRIAWVPSVSAIAASASASANASDPCIDSASGSGSKSKNRQRSSSQNRSGRQKNSKGWSKKKSGGAN